MKILNVTRMHDGRAAILELEHVIAMEPSSKGGTRIHMTSGIQFEVQQKYDDLDRAWKVYADSPRHWTDPERPTKWVPAEPTGSLTDQQMERDLEKAQGAR